MKEYAFIIFCPSRNTLGITFTIYQTRPYTYLINVGYPYPPNYKEASSHYKKENWLFFQGSKPSKQVIKTLTTVVSRVKMAHENRRWKHRKKIPTLEESILSLSRVMTLDSKVWDYFTHITCIEGHNPRNKYFYLKKKNLYC